MLKKRLCLLVALLSWTLLGEAQNGSISGTLTDEEGPVAFANIGLVGTSWGGASNAEGNFSILDLPSGEYKLEVSAVGYFTFKKTVFVSPGANTELNINMTTTASQLGEMVVTGTLKETYVKDSPVKVEVLSASFFETAPNNNVMEAIQLVNGVQEVIGCGVCGTSDIHINGMEGPYTLVMIDGMPIVSALSTVYGFSGIPSQLIERVEIVKGPASSLYGTEAVGGVINIITKSPESSPRLGFNAFYTSHGELNTDVATTLKVGEKVKGLFSGNFYNNHRSIDENNDNFTDIPLNSRFSIFNKWTLDRKEDRKFSFAARYYYEDRFGGVLDWEPENRGGDSIYGESIYTSRLEVIGSYQLPISGEHIRLDYSVNYHDQNSVYGNTAYIADQSVIFTNLIWDKKAGNHDLLVGGTFRRQTYDDNTPATPDSDAQIIPGLFAQDEVKISEKLAVLGGARLDHHSNHGLVFTPRMALKFQPGTWTTMRLNAGQGFRVVNLFTEDHAALTGARTVVIDGELAPEQSYNTNLNINQVYQSAVGIGSVDFDVFYNYFTNKIVPDYNVDPNLIVYNNLSGHGVVQGMALAVDHSLTIPLKLKLGITYQDVYNVSTDDGGNEVREQQVFAPEWSGTFLAGYNIKKWGVTIDYTGNVVGPQALPVYDEPFERDETSPWFTLQNVQVTKKMNSGLEVYTGARNVFDYTQPSPLVDPANPFGDAFDTAYAYGPLQGRRFFVGVRWNVP